VPTTGADGAFARLRLRASGVYGMYGHLPYDHVRSLVRARRYRAEIASVERFCMFIGHARSGHSIVGAALDAHPNIVTAHEANALLWLRGGMSRKQLYWLLLDHEQRYNDAGRPARYDYRVPGQWQGRVDRLTVIGDKHGPAAARWLAAKPRLFDRLRRLGDPLRMVEVVRNPFDNITTWAAREETDLDTARLRYFIRCQELEDIVRRLDTDEYAMVRHEHFVADPEGTLRTLCAFLGVDAPPDYLQACASIVYDRPHHSRDDAPWTDDLVKLVEDDIERYPTLAGYRFDA